MLKFLADYSKNIFVQVLFKEYFSLEKVNIPIRFPHDSNTTLFISRLDQEKAKNKQLNDKVKSLEQNLGFNDQRNNEQLKDANSE